MARSIGILRTAFSALVPRSLQAQMVALLGALVLVQIGISGIIFGSLVADVTKDQIGKRALSIAETVARHAAVLQGLQLGDPAGRVQALAEEIRLATGAEYVVVCDTAGVRLSHPDPWKIGQAFVGGDTGVVLTEGRSYVSEAVGTLGPSLRGFAPVRGPEGVLLGFVAVGYLREDVERTIHRHQLQPRVFVFMMALVGLIAAVLIANHFKRAILGLEPREIASLYRERSTILATLREGVVAVDDSGAIRLANPAARRALGLGDDAVLEGRPVAEVFPRAGLAEVLDTGAAVLDREVSRDGLDLIVNMIPVQVAGETVGVVASFRRKDELDQLTHELARTREAGEMLRTQAHEFSNKLHTIAGLIQIEAHQEALDLLLRESADYQDLIRFLGEAVPSPSLAGLILGKVNRASELKVQLNIDRESSLADLPAGFDCERLVTILGNLLENALEAAVRSPRRPRRVELSMTGLGRDLVFELDDSGDGIPRDLRDRMFERGVTTKADPGHGVGLYLVAENLRELGGSISIADSHLGGASVTVFIPKVKSEAT